MSDTTATPETRISPVKALIIELAQGNPGALRVCAQAYAFEGPVALGGIISSGLRGGAIWGAFKDECGEDMEAFLRRFCGRQI